jgi:hypothetical protein
LWAAGLFVAPVSTVAPALLFACFLLCLVAMSSFSKSAPHLSRCLHHHKPRARRPGRAATKEEAVNTDSNARFGGEVEWNVSGTAISFRRPSIELERLYSIADHRLCS